MNRINTSSTDQITDQPLEYKTTSTIVDTSITSREAKNIGKSFFAREKKMIGCHILPIIYTKAGMLIGLNCEQGHTQLGLPGGKLQSGETYTECLVRELQEELPLTPTTEPLLRQKKHKFHLTSATDDGKFEAHISIITIKIDGLFYVDVRYVERGCVHPYVFRVLYHAAKNGLFKAQYNVQIAAQLNGTHGEATNTDDVDQYEYVHFCVLCGYPIRARVRVTLGEHEAHQLCFSEISENKIFKLHAKHALAEKAFDALCVESCPLDSEAIVRSHYIPQDIQKIALARDWTKFTPGWNNNASSHNDWRWSHAAAVVPGGFFDDFTPLRMTCGGDFLEGIEPNPGPTVYLLAMYDTPKAAFIGLLDPSLRIPSIFVKDYDIYNVKLLFLEKYSIKLGKVSSISAFTLSTSDIVVTTMRRMNSLLYTRSWDCNDKDAALLSLFTAGDKRALLPTQTHTSFNLTPNFTSGNTVNISLGTFTTQTTIRKGFLKFRGVSSATGEYYIFGIGVSTTGTHVLPTAQSLFTPANPIVMYGFHEAQALRELWEYPINEFTVGAGETVWFLFRSLVGSVTVSGYITWETPRVVIESGSVIVSGGVVSIDSLPAVNIDTMPPVTIDDIPALTLAKNPLPVTLLGQSNFSLLAQCGDVEKNPGPGTMADLLAAAAQKQTLTPPDFSLSAALARAEKAAQESTTVRAISDNEVTVNEVPPLNEQEKRKMAEEKARGTWNIFCILSAWRYSVDNPENIEVGDEIDECNDETWPTRVDNTDRGGVIKGNDERKGRNKNDSAKGEIKQQTPAQVEDKKQNKMTSEEFRKKYNAIQSAKLKLAEKLNTLPLVVNYFSSRVLEGKAVNKSFMLYFLEPFISPQLHQHLRSFRITDVPTFMQILLGVVCVTVDGFWTQLESVSSINTKMGFSVFPFDRYTNRKIDLTMDGDIESNPGPPSDEARNLELLKNDPLARELTEHRVKDDSFVKKLFDVEREVFQLIHTYPGLEHATKREIDNRIAQSATADIPFMDKLVNDAINVIDPSLMYLGPSYMGGKMGPVSSLTEALIRMMIEPGSELDRMARQHDLAFTIGEEFKDEANRRFIENVESLVPKTTMEAVLNKMAVEAIKKEPIYRKGITWDLLVPGKKKTTRNEWVEDLTKTGTVEPNPGPLSIVKLLAAIKAWNNGEFTSDGKTVFGWFVLNQSMQGQLVTALYDEYLKQAFRKVSWTVNNLVITGDTPFDGHTVFPARVRIAGASHTVNLPQGGWRWMRGSGPGPATMDTELTRSFVASADTMKDMITALRTNVAYYEGMLLYLLWTMTSAATDGSSDEISSIGSMAYVWANILVDTFKNEATTQFMNIQNFGEGSYARVNSIGPNPATRFPNLGVNDNRLLIGTCSIRDYLTWKTSDAGARVIVNDAPVPVPLSVEPIFVFVTSQMLARDLSTRKSFATWLRGHLPYPYRAVSANIRWKNTKRVIDTVIYDEPVVADWNTEIYDTGNGQGVYVVIVNCIPAASPGAIGQARQNYSILFGNDVTQVAITSDITSPVNNNPLMTQTAPNVFNWVDASNAMDALVTDFRNEDKAVHVTRCLNWFAQLYNSRECIKLGNALAASRLQAFAPNASTLWTHTGNARKGMNTGSFDNPVIIVSPYDYTEWTVPAFTTFMTGWENCWGSKMTGDNEFPQITIPVMPAIMQCALVMGVRAMKQQNRMKMDGNNINLFGAWMQLMELGKAMRAQTDYLMESTHSTEDILDGRLFGGGTVTDVSTLAREHLAPNILAEIGCILTVITHPTPQGFLAAASSEMGADNTVFRYLIDKSWETTPFYEVGSTAASRDPYALLGIDQRIMPTLRITNYAQDPAAIITTVINSELSIEQYCKMCQPQPTRTAMAIAQPADDFWLQEYSTNVVFPVSLVWLNGSASTAYGPLRGTIAQFILSPSGATDQAAFIDYPIPRLSGSYMNNPLSWAYTAPSSLVMQSAHTLPYWICQTPTKMPTAGFLLPMVNSQSKDATKMLAALTGQVQKEEK